MALQVKEGVEYKARNGEKIGPMYRTGGTGDWGSEWEFSVDHSLKGADGYGVGWRIDGTFDPSSKDKKHGLDLISEWSDPIESPIRTVTRRVLVSGDYGILRVFHHSPATRTIAVEMGISTTGSMRSADELRSAAMVLSQLAEFLDEDKGDE